MDGWWVGGWECVDGWMDGMLGWSGWMDEWTDGRMNG